MAGGGARHGEGGEGAPGRGDGLGRGHQAEVDLDLAAAVWAHGAERALAGVTCQHLYTSAVQPWRHEDQLQLEIPIR